MENEEITVVEGVGTLTLSKAIDIDGTKVKELKYNFDDMTARDKQRAGLAFKKSGGGVSVQELDSDYHLFLFGAGVSFGDSEDGCSSSSLIAFLKSFIPFPIPLISSGIFLPPNNSNKAITTITICAPEIASMIIISSFICLSTKIVFPVRSYCFYHFFL